MTDKNLIEAAGGIRPCARALGHKWHTRVQYWYENDRIPSDAIREEIRRLGRPSPTQESEAAGRSARPDFPALKESA